MVIYRDPYGNSDSINKIFKNAEEFIYILSPFIRISERYKELLTYRLNEGIDVRLIYGKDELLSEERQWLNKNKNIVVAFKKNLHAKCYMNEKTILITSMNLYEFSQENNFEMGLEIEKEENPQLYDEIFRDVQMVYDMAKKIKVNKDEVLEDNEAKPIKKKEVSKKDPKNETPKKKDSELNGTCIRCKRSIELNVLRPFCNVCIGDCVDDPKKQHTYCHICGKENRSSLEKPVCYSCYKKNKNLFE